MTERPSTAPEGADSYPRLAARTQRFTLGQPRAFTTSRDGHALFLRSKAGDDRVTCLWRMDGDSSEHLLADPRTLLAGNDEGDLSVEEQARRERLREGAGGIVAYGVDNARHIAAFALAGRLWVADVLDAMVREIDGASNVIDPRPSPDGTRVAFVSHGALHVADLTTGRVKRLVGPEPDEADVTWGLAEFVAAEEMGRYRGFWWSPGSDALLVARVDESPVPVWHIADPANPDAPARATRYPAAGTADAHVSLWLVRLDGTRAEAEWDHDAYPYLTTVSWPTDEYVAMESERRAMVQVMSRSQQQARILAVDPLDASTTTLRDLRSSTWIDLVPGAPTWGAGGEVLTIESVGNATSLFVDAKPYTQEHVQVRAILAVDDTEIVLAVSPTEDPTQRWTMTFDTDSSPESGNIDDADGIHSWADGVHVHATWDSPSVATFGEHTIPSFALEPPVIPRPHLLRSRVRGIVTAVYLPTGHEPGSRSLPVLMSPYGGPHAQRVLAARNAHLESQWLADQGFAVVVADGRGTPRTPVWERAVRLDLAGPVLEDQVEALTAAAEAHPDLDLTRVGIRGWSFGGYLAALAVLRRPDVFHAAVAGAPVTDWALYDTFYTERYLGHPHEHPEAYAQSSLIDEAADLTRPLMLIHGLADDNVVAAHTLRLSSALLAAGRPHTVLPLSGVTHMTPQEVVAENLLLLQVDFLRDHLGA
jgi:dipeptidyl-peptidase-4